MGGQPQFEPPPHWLPPTEPPVRQAAKPAELDFSAAVEDESDGVDIEASPAEWLSARALLVLSVVVGVILVAAVVGSLLYWLTPPIHAVSVPLVPQG